MSKLAKILFLILVLSNPAGAGFKDSTFIQANKFYDRGNYPAAIQEYLKLVEAGVRNHNLYYNLANSYYRNKELGEAILYYKKALKLSPKDEDIQTNLNFTRLFALDKIPQPRKSLLKQLLEQWNVNSLSWFLSFFYSLSLLLGSSFFFIKKYQKLLKIFLVSSIIFFILIGTVWLNNFRAVSLAEVVVVAGEVQVRSGPGDDYTLQFTGHEGLEVVVEDEKEAWCLVRITTQVKGWIPKKAVLKV